MKGFYAPILGFVLLALAVGFGLYVIQAEKSYTGLLENFSAKLRFITYGEISVFDVQTSLSAYIRQRTYAELNNPITARDTIDFIKRKIPAWINAFYDDVEKNTKEVIVRLEERPRISSVSMKELSEALLFKPKGSPGRISIDLSPSGVPLKIEKPLPLPSFLLAPFPLEEAKKVEEEVNDAEEVLKECSSKVKGRVGHYHCGSKGIHYLKRDDYPSSCLNGLDVSTLVHSVWLFELNSECGVVEKGSLVTGVVRIWKREKISWTPPGLEGPIQVSVAAAKDVDIDFFPGIGDANAILVDGYYVFVNAPKGRIFQEINNVCHNTNLPFCDHHCFR